MTKDLIIGSHIAFARAGSTVDGEVVVSTALPDFATTQEDWEKLGSVEEWEPKREKTEVKRRAPVPGGGKYGLRKKFTLSTSLVHAFSLQEFTATHFEILLNADGIAPSTGAYTPNSREEEIEGWLHLQAYDQKNDQIVEETSWVSLSMDSYKFAEKLDPHTLMAEVIANPLNTGALTNLT